MHEQRLAPQVLPLDLIEHASQPFRACRVHALDPCDLAVQMCAEITQARPVFRVWSIPWCAGIAQAGQEPGDRPRVAETAEYVMRPCQSGVEEEVFQIDRDDDAFTGMHLRSAKTGPACDEAMRGIVHGTRSRISCKMRRWIAINFGLGISIKRGGPLFFGAKAYR